MRFCDILLAASVGQSGTAPITETAAAYSDDFNSYADNTTLRSIGWSAISAQGASDGANDNAVVVSGQVTRKSASPVSDFQAYNGISTAGKYFMSPHDAGSTNHFLQFRIKALTAIGMSVLGTDEVNRLNIDITSSAFNLNRYLNTSVTSAAGLTGSATSRYAGGATGGIFKRPALEDLVVARVYGGKAYLSRNHAPVGLAAGYDVSAITGTKVGFSTYNGQYRDVDDMKAGPLAGRLAITSTTKKAYPRVQGLGGYANGAADITWSGTYEGTVTRLQWALFDGETGALVKDWAWPTSESVAAGAWSATCRVPCGLNGVKPYRIAFRASNDTFVEIGDYTPFFVSYSVLVTGQSNGKNLHSTNATGSIPDHSGGAGYVDPDTDTVYTDGFPIMVSSWEDSTSEGTANDNNTGNATKLLSEALSLPVLFINLCIAASGSTAHDPAAVSANGDFLRGNLANAGGAFDAIYVNQGENEVNVSEATVAPAQAWKAQWETNITNWKAISGQPVGTVIPVFISLTGEYESATSVAPANILRQAQKQLVSELADCHLAYHPVGLAISDGVHYDTTGTDGQAKAATRLGLTLRNVLAAGAYDGRGPYATTASRAGAVVTLPVTLNGAASIAGTALTSWEASTSSTFGSLLTINSAEVSGNDVVLTLSADPGAPVYVRNYSGANPDASSWVVGTYADASDIPMEPVVVPILTAS